MPEIDFENRIHRTFVWCIWFVVITIKLPYILLKVVTYWLVVLDNRMTLKLKDAVADFNRKNN